jgi:hypothetical protein
VLEETRPLYARKNPGRVDTTWQIPMAKAVDRWMRVAGRPDLNAWESTVDLYLSWRSWCATQQFVTPGSPARFCHIIKRQLVAQRLKRGRGWRGFRLKGGSG